MSHDSKISKKFGSLDVNGRVLLAKSNVTQATNLATAVATSTSTGVITTVSASNVAGASASFNVTNPNVSATSTVFLTINNYAGNTGLPLVRVNNVSSGQFTVVVTNAHGTDALNGVLKIGYLVL